jgi:hypothetical protein
VGVYDETIMLDSAWLTWMGPIYEALKSGPQDLPLFSFSYPEFVKEFGHVNEDLKMEGVVPYQMRHSGPSVDRCRELRTSLEVQRRGRWKTIKSLLRYERAARMAREWHSYSARQQTLFESCEAALEALMLGRKVGGLCLP